MGTAFIYIVRLLIDTTFHQHHSPAEKRAIQFFDGAVSCQHGREKSAGNGLGCAPFIYELSFSCTVPPLFSMAGTNGDGNALSSTLLRFLNGNTSFEHDKDISAGNGH